MARSGWLSALVFAALALPAAAQEARHGLLPTKRPLHEEIRDPWIDVVGDRVVVGLYENCNDKIIQYTTMLLLLDRSTLSLVAEVERVSPAAVNVLQGALKVWNKSGSSTSHPRLHDLKTGAQVLDLGENGFMASTREHVYCVGEGEVVKRLEPATGRVLWERKLEPTFGRIQCLSCAKDGVWVESQDRRAWCLLGLQDGAVKQRVQLPAVTGQPTYHPLGFEVGGRDVLAVPVSNVDIGGGKRGTIFRVIEAGKVKELVFPGGAETVLGYVGRADRDSVPWAFARRGKRYVILQGRGDHGDQPPADTYFAVDLGGLKVVESTPMVESEAVNDLGWVLTKAGKAVDLTTGKATVTLPADLTWRGLTDAYALAWSAPAGTLTVTPLAGGAAKKVALAGEAKLASLRRGDLVVALVAADGKTTVKLIDPAKAVATDVAVHEGEAKLLIASESVIDGQVWLLVQEKTPDGLRVHVHAANVP